MSRPEPQRRRRLQCLALRPSCQLPLEWAGRTLPVLAARLRLRSNHRSSSSRPRKHPSCRLLGQAPRISWALRLGAAAGRPRRLRLSSQALHPQHRQPLHSRRRAAGSPRLPSSRRRRRRAGRCLQLELLRMSLQGMLSGPFRPKLDLQVPQLLEVASYLLPPRPPAVVQVRVRGRRARLQRQGRRLQRRRRRRQPSSRLARARACLQAPLALPRRRHQTRQGRHRHAICSPPHRQRRAPVLPLRQRRRGRQPRRVGRWGDPSPP